jgi:hypothetical protein
MTKIALLICGTIRNYKQNYLTWKKYLLDLYDTSIFFHTYDVNGYHLKTNNILSQLEIETLIKTIKPKKYLIESYDTKLNDFKNLIQSQCLRNGSAKPESIKSQLYGIYMVNMLKKIHEKENNFKYDIVIKIRFDTVFYNNFNIKDINLITKYNNVILCGNPEIKTMLYKNACVNCINNFNNNNFNKCNNHTDISDIVIISTSKNMDYYAKIYFKYDILLKQYHDKVIEMYKHNLNKYISHVYDNGSIIYIQVPKISCVYPELALSLHLKDYMLLNYTFNVDTNRNII